MTFEFKPAKRENVQVIVGLAGPSGSGKTLSALRLAAGLAGGQQFVYIDTESGRALHYADDFDFLHADFSAPFTPARYREAIAQATARKPPVLVIDSMTHEHSGPGGVIQMQVAELDRLAGSDFKKRERMNQAAWIKPKAERKLLINDLLALRCHLILCFRAEEKTEMVDDPTKPGKKKVVPKKILAGHVGWIPVCGKEYPYELTLSLVVTPDNPGVPHAIKLMKDHKPLVPLDKPLDEQVGQALAAWAKGSQDPPVDPPAAPSSPEAGNADPGSPSWDGDQQAEDKPPRTVSSAAGFTPPAAALEQARDTVIPVGQQSGKTLAWMAEQGEKGDRWFLNALRSEDVTGEFRGSVELFVRAEKPEVWAEYQQAVLA